MATSVFYIALALAVIAVQVQANCPGCVELDEITFAKVVPKFRYSLIKFDIAFPYGEKHEAFSDFAKTVSANVDDLFIGLVGVKDYGEKENSQLAERYGIDEKKYPAILLFVGNDMTNAVRYPEDRPVDVDNLKQFVKEQSGLYIGLDGCLKEMDLLVTEVLGKSAEEQKEVLERASQLRDGYADVKIKDTAKVYTTIISRILDKGPKFVPDERRRLENLLKSKISENKKKELSHRLNILQSFERGPIAKKAKDEL